MLYAIRNGGFSGAIMPQNIVVGEDAEAVAEFVAKYAGTDATDARPRRAPHRALPPVLGPEAEARSQPRST